jgi:pectin methylesterase-like acyl-CoA thioesterase
VKVRTAVLVAALVIGGGGIADAQACRILTVAPDGSGDFTTVQAAVDAVPDGVAYTIRIRPGHYREVVKIPATKPNLTLLGTTGDPADAVVDFDNASGTLKPDGTPFGTTGSATVTIAASDFTARFVTFSNSFERAAHPEITATQAVAMKATGDRMLFDRDRFVSHQDTVYADTSSVDVRARQYYRRSAITGDVDFMFGRATAVFDQVTITALDRGGDPNGYLTAASTRTENPHGFLIVHSTVTSPAAASTYFLGRPWHPSGDPNAIAQVVIRDTWLPAAIKTAPWTDFSGFSWRDARLFEFHNSGPGATAGPDRPQLSPADATQFTVRTYLGDWNPR